MTNFKSSEIHCVHGPDTDVNAYAIRLCLQKIVSQEEKSNSVMQKEKKKKIDGERTIWGVS